MLRQKIPQRSNPKAQNKYGNYKDQLRSDFNTRCGYCDDLDENYGFAMGFHIDHFAPQKYFPELVTTYSNLIYSCPVCNRAKSATWVGRDASISNDGKIGFVDPCTSTYDDHLYRLPNGLIAAHTPLGEYKIQKLKLNLIRHQLNWQICTLFDLMSELEDLSKQATNNSKELVKVSAALSTVVGYYIKCVGRRRASC